MILNRYERTVARRYLLPGQGEGFIFLVASISLVAVALGVGKSTVAAHIDHIRTKLDASTRDVAVLRGQRLGLYIPCRLTSLSRRSP